MKRLSLLGILALAACAEVLSPRQTCACSPPEPIALLTGALTAETGQAVRGARVQFVARMPNNPQHQVSRSALTDSAGIFRLYAGGPIEDSVWVHIFVHDTASGAISRPAPDSVRVRFRFGEPRDSVWIPLTFVP